MTLPRPLDPAESLFWMLDQVSSMNFAVYADSRTPLQEDALRSALQRVQAAHPLLRVAIARDASQALHFQPQASDLELDCVRPEDDGRQDLADAIVQPFALAAAPLLRARWQRWDDGRWRLALIFQHSIADGRSAFALLWEVLQLALQPALSIETRSALPPLHAGFPPQWRGAAGEAALTALKAARKAEFAPLGKPQDQPGYDARPGLAMLPCSQRIELDAAHTTRLAARARAAATSVHGVVGAAQLRALAGRFGPQAAPTLALTSPVDLRAHCTPPMPDHTPAFAVSLLSSRLQLPPHEDLWSLGRLLSTDIQHCLHRGDGHLFFQLMPGPPRLLASDAGITQFAQILAASPQHSLLSNVGRLAPPSDLPLALDEAGFALFPMPGQPLFSAVATLHGRLGINVNYDAARWDATAIGAVLADMRSLLADAAR
jgi:hypothetical protein